MPRRALILLPLLLLLDLPLAGALQNQMRQHPSPYLAMHAADPVQWQQWGGEVLQRARSENKLLFISSGYFACHWCHVMQRESYGDGEIAALLNNHFIPVKIDRELQPALDAHLIDFVRRTRGTAGWPLNVFLTPEGYPLIGLTYSPPDNFRLLLQRLRSLWQTRAAELAETARIAAQTEAAAESPAAESEMDAKTLHTALLRAALALGDDMEGGFGRQNRFPMAPQLSVLLDRLRAAPNSQLREFMELTLDQMAGQGLRDHLGGGFFRYTVDPGWQIPHYEKMLYTQALLARLYIKAAGVLERPDYLQVARDTLDFALRVMAGRDGGFIASLSALDPAGEEGGGYLWSDVVLREVLDREEIRFARLRWRLQGDAPTATDYLPVDGASPEQLQASLGIDREQLDMLELRVRQKLLSARAPRNHPRDGKQLAAWNGLMLSALVEGARALNHPPFREAAKRLRDYLLNHLWDGQQLRRAHAAGGELGRAALEDYVYVAAGLWEWGELSGASGDLELARELMRSAWRRFYRDRGWQASDDLLLPGIALERAISDGALPSPAAMLIELSLQSGDEALTALAGAAVRLGYPLAREQPIWYATQVAAGIRQLQSARPAEP
ncbi:MAG: thioredoxin domain-containing protein [Gammaproteobacteria bacterium]|nr:thioredoxin domain-containing protein [Gammaproteobacteria bacterium]